MGFRSGQDRFRHRRFPCWGHLRNRQGEDCLLVIILVFDPFWQWADHLDFLNRLRILVSQNQPHFSFFVFFILAPFGILFSFAFSSFPVLPKSLLRLLR